jgi:predicted phage-related endonuclease
MKINNCQQQSPEWYQIHAGKIGGTHFGAVISGKKNRLLYDLLEEQYNGTMSHDEYVSPDIDFGNDNEPVARQLYSKQSGIKFREVGFIMSEESDLHIASPDGLSPDNSIVLEIKCTQNGAIHIQRHFEGPETGHMPQVINYFAVSDEVKEVHWISYCPFRPERPIVVHKFHRDGFEKEIEKGRAGIKRIEQNLIEARQQFEF